MHFSSLLKDSLHSRFDRLDALRGMALVWMAGFHFCFDLSQLHHLNADFYHDAIWQWQRTFILSLFLMCAGAGLAVAAAQGQTWQRFWQRWRQIAFCAALVSVASWWLFPHSYIYIGVLHGMAVMLVLGRMLAGLMATSTRLAVQSKGLRRVEILALGLILVLLPLWVQHPWFDTRATNWLGLITHKPVTEDYVPILPWFGVMLWGLAVGQWLLTHRPLWIGGALPRWSRPLSFLGRWSLTFYMLHQPIFIGLLQCYEALLRP